MTHNIEIFKSGSHTSAGGDDVSISDVDLSAAVTAYDPSASEAPLVIGHPDDKAPAYGWVKKLSTTSGSLVAEVDQIDPAFAELVRAGRYKKISASFYSPQSRHNPKPGVWYLRHVGFLGAQPPAVKGLKSVSFSAADIDGVMIFSTENKGTEKMTEEEIKAQAAALAAGNAALAREKADFAEAQAVAKNRATKDADDAIAAKLADIAARENALALKEHVSFAEDLVKAGKLLPKDKQTVVAIMVDIPRDCVVNFAEGKKKPMLESFKEFLEGQPVKADFSERAPAGTNPDTDKYITEGMAIAAAAGFKPKG